MIDDLPEPRGADSLPKYSLRGWLGKVTGRRWLRLFVFEFFVILLGVLAAQGLQSWFVDRSERRAAVAAKATLDRNLASIALSAEIRLRSMTCFNDRVGKIAIALRAGAQPKISLTPPNEALVIDLGWSGGVPALIADHYNDETVEHYANASLWAESLRRHQSAEQVSWHDLGRLSPLLGEVTQSDRSIAKGSVIGAIHSLRNIYYAATHLRTHAIEMNNAPDLAELKLYRAQSDPCRAAMGYLLEEHGAAGRQNRLVTGEPLE